MFENETLKNMSIPIPSNLRISTHTATCKLSSEINLSIVAEKLEINTNIIYIEYADMVSKGVNIKTISKKAKDKKKVFYNQITIIVQPFKNRYNNIKLFNNGAVSMTGLKNFDEGEKSIKILIDKISNLKGFIFNELDDKFINKNSLVIDDKSSIKCNSCGSNHNYNITKYSYCGCYFCNSCVSEKKALNNNKCINCSKNLLKDALCEKNCKINDYKIVLINSDYFVGFEIKRDELHKILVNKYNIYSSYEPCIYPGVNSKFYWNKEYKDYPFTGKCYCTDFCNGKGSGDGNGKCKKITISIFQSGSLIITGGRSMEQILDAYNFINKVLNDNYSSIKKINAPFLEKEELKPSNSSKKKTIKIKMSNIKNFPNESFIKTLIDKYSSNDGINNEDINNYYNNNDPFIIFETI
jgi:TATA-box binding protein (TBP) (component of TFIID and TFIIIB)